MILQFIFPQTCRVCSCLLSGEEKICGDCLKEIRFLNEPWCPVCSTPYPQTVGQSHPCPECTRNPPAFSWHRSCVLYNKTSSSLIQSLKYGGQLDRVPLFTEWIIQRYHFLVADADFIIPVPLNRHRLRSRTYNQSLEIARSLGKQLTIPVLPHSLQKTRKTSPQTELSRQDRLSNLRGAFAWKGREVLEGKKIVLIDDVHTTGSTLEVCAKVIKKLKPREMGAVTIALQPKEIP